MNEESGPAVEYVAMLPEPQRRRLGRTIRTVVDETLRHGDGSGERSAREAFLKLAHALDPEEAGTEDDAEQLLGRSLTDPRTRP